MLKKLVTAVAVTFVMTAGAHASTLSGVFSLDIVNVQNVNGGESGASIADFNDAANGIVGTDTESDTGVYIGDLNFGTFDGSDGTTIGDWLASSGGTNIGFDSGFLDLQLSKPRIGRGTATTSFFRFTLNGALSNGGLEITHDDGVGVYDLDGPIFLGGFEDPTGVRTTSIAPFSGGTLQIIYVATNGDPSVLRVSEVPLPASAFLLLGGLGGLAAMRRRAKA